MPTSVTVNANDVLLSLGDLRGRVDAKTNMLRIIGELMYASVIRTFRDQGSPAGSWPALAASTLKKKGYTTGHQLLVLTGRLRNSITYWIEGDRLTIGTNVVYAAVHQYGSSDRRGGSVGAQARIAGRETKVSAYDSLRVVPFRKYDLDARKDKNGKTRMVRTRLQGADNATRFGVEAHDRFQNIPARPFLVIRPEDPARFAAGIDSYLGSGKLKFGGA